MKIFSIVQDAPQLQVMDGDAQQRGLVQILCPSLQGQSLGYVDECVVLFLAPGVSQNSRLLLRPAGACTKVNNGFSCNTYVPVSYVKTTYFFPSMLNEDLDLKKVSLCLLCK